MPSVRTLASTVPVCPGGGVVDLRGRRLSARFYLEGDGSAITGVRIRGGAWSNRMLIPGGEVPGPVFGTWLLLDVRLGDLAEFAQAREIGLVVEFQFAGTSDEVPVKVWIDSVQIE